MSRIAVIGAGYWGRNLVRNFASLGALAAICDGDAASLAAMAKAQPGIPVHADAASVLADNSIAAVAIATPAVTHGALAAQALAAGKHVFVEKPLCLDLEEAERLAALAQSKGLVLMVGHMLLYHPAFVALRSKIAAGDIGRLRYVYSTRLSLGKIRREENALWSFAPHDVSMILRLTGRMPRRVVANGEAFLTAGVADTTLSHLTFDDELQAHIFVSWLHPYKDQRLVVIGSEGMLVFNDVAPAPEKLLFYRHRVGWDGDLPSVDKADAIPVPFAADEPLNAECRHFLDCVATGQQPESDALEGIRVLKVLDACQRALNSRQPVDLIV